jgi:hypothetical protein
MPIIDNPKLYEKAKKIADEKYSKPSAYKSGFIVKTYKELGGTYTDDKNPKNLKRWFKEDWKDIGNKEYPVYRPTKRINKKTPLLPQEINNLSQQIKLKQKIKGTHNLPPFSPFLKKDPKRNDWEKKKSNDNNMVRRRKEGGNAKDFFRKVGNFLKPVAKAVAPSLINMAKPIVTAGLSSFAPEFAPAIALGVDALGNAGNRAIQGMGIRLTKKQAHHLRSGGEITITRSALVPNRPTHTLILHPERMERLANMVRENHPRVAMSLKEGEGIKDFFKGAYNKVLKPIGKALAPIAINAGKKAFTDKYGDEYSGVADVLGNVANQGIQGMGTKSMRKRHRKSGGSAYVPVASNGLVREESFVPVMYGGGVLHITHGGAINTHGGMNANENYVEYPIQLGSPYAKIQSQSMNPFFANHNPYFQYSPIKSGGSFMPSGGRGINPPGGGGGINPAGYRSYR